jgi:branched-chain amino acid transport system substrate-binding protein
MLADEGTRPMRRGNVDTVALAGDFKEILFADLLQFYCLSGQTAAVSVRAADERGVETTGTFFIDGGVLVDAVFDGREGSEAVRRAVRRLKRGVFQVQLGTRSERRTIHEPWSALVLDELRQLESADMPVGMKSAAPALAAAFGRGAPRTPTPPGGTSGELSRGRMQTPPVGIRVTGTGPAPNAPSRGVPAPRGTPAAGTPAARRTPPHGTTAVETQKAIEPAPRHPSPEPAPPARTAPASGPHRQTTGSGPLRAPTPSAVPESRPNSGPLPQPPGSGPGRVPTPTSAPHRADGSGPKPVPPTAPFSRIRRERRASPLLRLALLVACALVAGGALAVLVTQLLPRGSGAVASTSAESVPVATQAPPPQPAPPANPGVTDTELVLGMAAPFTGSSKELGRQMRVGLEVAFAAANAEGGVHGRRLRLVALDDGYEPSRTPQVMRELAEQRGVFGFIGNVGTPTAAVALPYALGRQMLFFSPFTGASLLRKDPPDRTVFNYRASYLEETSAIVRYLVEVRRIRPEQIAVFAQNDSFGDAGYQGVVRTLRQFKRDGAAVLKVTYERNTTDVANAVARVLERKDRIKAVVMVATYRAAARFIEQVRTQRPQMLFTNVSFVGSQALAEELVQVSPRLAEGIIVTQVVPLPTSRSTAVLHYQEALARYAPGEKPDFVSLEGYIDGNLLIEGLRRAGPSLSTDRLVKALEDIHGLDLGLGTPVSFGSTEHQASHKVWGTVIDRAGNYQALDLD